MFKLQKLELKEHEKTQIINNFIQSKADGRSAESGRDYGRMAKSFIEQTYFRRGDLKIDCADDFTFSQILSGKVDFPFSKQRSIEMQRIIIAFLSQKTYGIEEKEENIEKAEEQANIEC